MQYCRAPLRCASFTFLLALIIWLIQCTLFSYLMFLVYDFSSSYDTIRREHEQHYLQANVNNRCTNEMSHMSLRSDIFGETMVRLFQQHELLEFTQCNKRTSPCFLFVRSLMSYVLDREFILRLLMISITIIWAKLTWVLPKTTMNRLEVRKMTIKLEKEKQS